MTSFLATFRQTFLPLQSANFRTYLIGQVISLVGTWLQMTAQSWVVWEISGSNAALGVVAMLGTLPILLLGPWAGVWADRLDRRKMLIWTQVAAMVLAITLAVLTQLKIVELWHVYILSALLGIVTALDMPAQQAFIGDLAGMGEVRKAIVLNAMVIQVSRILGPALAGFLVGTLGAALAFWINGVSFIAVIISLMMVTSVQIRKTGAVKPLNEFWEGLRFIRSQPRLADLIIFVMIITFFGIPIITIFPAVADELLHGDAQTLGWLLAASGVGALVSTLVVVPITQAQKRIGLVVAAVTVWMGFWFLLIGVTSWLPLAIFSSFATGLGAPVVFTTANGMLQVLSPANMRARLLSTFVMLSFGTQPIASLVLGLVAEQLGTATAIVINGSLIIVGAGIMLMLRPALRVWELSTTQAAVPVSVEMVEL